MTVAVFTPTCRPGGIDVNREGLLRQRRTDLLWIVGDDLYSERIIASTPELPVLHFDTAQNKRANGAPSSLAAAYRHGIEVARDYGADLLISMQDYLWIPDDGIARFEQMAREFPTSLLTGLCSLSNDPYADTVVDPDGGYTIFAEPFSGQKPIDIGWPDCRLEVWEPDTVAKADVIWWEANWAAIPRAPLHDKRLNFDVAYDQGHYYENQDYAMRAAALGYDVWIDTGNHAIGLPHKAYFPEQQRVLESQNNREWHETRHGLRR